MATVGLRRPWSLPRRTVVLLAGIGLLVAVGLGGVLARPAGPAMTITGATEPDFRVAASVVPWPLRETVLVGTEQGARSKFVAFNARTGQVLGSVDASFGPMVVLRTSHKQLLVSDVVADTPNGGGLPHPRLLWLDEQLSVIRVVPLPTRIMYTLYAPAMTLSADQSLLYYVGSTSCGAGCDDYAVIGLNLDSGAQVVAADLPRGCGYAQLTAFAKTDVVAMCPALRSLFQISPRGGVVSLATFSATGWPIAGGATQDGRRYLVTESGGLIVQDSSGAVLIDRTVAPAGMRFSGVQRWSLKGRVALGLKSTTDIEMDGVVFLDSNTFATRVVQLPAGSTAIAPLSQERLAVLHSGVASVLDLADGSLGPNISAPGGGLMLIGPPKPDGGSDDDD